VILLTGGSGVLGTELLKHTPALCPGHEELDITKPIHSISSHVRLIVHLAAFTDLVRAEKEKELCYATNVLGTRNLASLKIPMLYISTEYVFDGERGNYGEDDYPNPQNFYALTKLLAEYEARRTRAVVIRCLFKPRPFKHADACIDQFTSGDYVERIAAEIAFAIKHFNDLPPTLHIGTGRKSTYELARETREVGKIKVDDVRGVKLPRDTSLNLSKWTELKCKLSLPKPITA